LEVFSPKISDIQWTHLLKKMKSMKMNVAQLIKKGSIKRSIEKGGEDFWTS